MSMAGGGASRDAETAAGAASVPEADAWLPRTVRRASTLVVSDTLSFLLAVGFALLCAVGARWFLLGVVRFPVADDISRIVTVFLPSYLILIGRGFSLGHYFHYRPFWSEQREHVRTVVLIALFIAFILFVMLLQFSRLWFGFFLLLLIVVVPVGREVAKRWLIRRGLWYQRTYIVGTGPNARRAARALASDPSLGHRVAGFVDLDGAASGEPASTGLPVLARLPSDEARGQFADHLSLVFAFDTIEEQERHQALMNERIASTEFVWVVPPPMELPLYNASVVGIFRSDTAVIRLQNRLVDPKTRLLKRLTDLYLGIALLILLAPLFLALAVLVRRDGGPVLYRHERIGKDGRRFSCLKFRSMVVEGDALLERHLAADEQAAAAWRSARKLKADPRVTAVGRYLRRTSIDELPQLINVIRGEMSLVGPRPIVTDELAFYGDHAPYYLSMTPGMTGLWQVSGRTETSYAERVRLDVWYSRNWSIWTDFVILLQTLKTLVRRHGAY